MRTTLPVDDQLAVDLKRPALDTNRSFKKVVNGTPRSGLRAGLRAGPTPTGRYRLRPARPGGVRAGTDPDRAPRVANALEEDEILRELQLRRRPDARPNRRIPGPFRHRRK